MGFFSDFSGKWFGIGMGGGVVLDEICRFVWRSTFGKKTLISEEDDEEDVGDRSILLRELGILRGNLPVSSQKTMEVQFGVIDAFSYTDASEEAAAIIGKELFAAVIAHNRKMGYSDLGVECTDFEAFLEERENALIEAIEGSSKTEEVCASTVSAVRWIISVLRQPEKKVMANA